MLLKTCTKCRHLFIIETICSEKNKLLSYLPSITGSPSCNNPMAFSGWLHRKQAQCFSAALNSNTSKYRTLWSSCRRVSWSCNTDATHEEPAGGYSVSFQATNQSKDKMWLPNVWFASLMSLMASLVTTSRMQQCFNVLIDIYHEFLSLFYCCVLLEIKLTTTTTTTKCSPAFKIFQATPSCTLRDLKYKEGPGQCVEAASQTHVSNQSNILCKGTGMNRVDII